MFASGHSLSLAIADTLLPGQAVRQFGGRPGNWAYNYRIDMDAALKPALLNASTA